MMGRQRLAWAVSGEMSPWRRLFWTTPLSALLWSGVLWGFGRMLSEPPMAQRNLAPIEVSLMGGGGAGGGIGAAPGRPAPLPAAAHSPPPAPPKPRRVAALLPTRPARPRRPPRPPVAPRRRAPLKRPAPGAMAKLTRPGAVAAPGAIAPGAGAPGPGNKAPGAGPGAGLGGLGTASSGAQAIYTPLPRIPDEMRRDPLNEIAIARFEIAPDGAARVVLVKPTASPRLNYLLLEALKQWRFFPAEKDGKPVASVVDLRIPVVVR